MAKGIGIHIGLNAVDPSGYGGWSGPLNACEADAKDMCAITKSKNYETQLYLTSRATSGTVLEALGSASRTLRAGDQLVLSYSGHGGQVPDTNGEESDEVDGQDETWCLYDREVIDDELYAAFGEFERGVRILVFSDSCHSGSVVKVARIIDDARSPGSREEVAVAQPTFRAMPPDVAMRVYAANKDLYDSIQKKNPHGERVGIGASVVLISGCQDNQLSADGSRNGLFTEMLLQVWSGGSFTGGLRRFHRAILRKMPPWQTPNYFRVGIHDPAFERQKLFTF